MRPLSAWGFGFGSGFSPTGSGNGGDSVASFSLEFPSISPVTGDLGGTIYPEEEAIELNGSTTQGILSGRVQLPKNFDRTKNAFFVIHFSTPATGTGNIVLQGQHQIIGSGTVDYSISGFILATETLSITSTALVRHHVFSVLKIASYTANPGDLVYHRLYRFPSNGGDTFDNKPIKIYNSGIIYQGSD